MQAHFEIYCKFQHETPRSFILLFLPRNYLFYKINIDEAICFSFGGEPSQKLKQLNYTYSTVKRDAVLVFKRAIGKQN